jgi:signal peptidase I
MRWFEITLVSLTFLTGIIWLLDRLFFAKHRRGADGLLDENREPVVVDYARAFFPVLAFVLILRSFIAEPFKIPSSSMMPSLLIGDFILVNKFAYGIRLPISNDKVIEVGSPARGDVVVFRYPGRDASDPNKGVDYIKRIIGLPGDVVSYRDNQVTVNGKLYAYKNLGEYVGKGPGVEMNGATELVEDMPGRPHPVLEITNIPHIDQGEGEWTVPQGQYLVMGDNRDRSDDGRFWGFLPEKQLRGKAFLIWLNCKGWGCRDSFEPSRIGNSIQ